MIDAIAQLPPSALNIRSEFVASHYTIRCPQGTKYSDIFHPLFYAHVGRHLKEMDTLRLIAPDWSWDVTVTVIKNASVGIKVQRTPLIPDVSVETEVIDVPWLANGLCAIRTDYARAVGWRVIGLDGSQKGTGYGTEAEAEAAMNAYVESIGMRFVPKPESLLAAEADAKAGKQRGAVPKPQAKKDAA